MQLKFKIENLKFIEDLRTGLFFDKVEHRF